MPNKNYIRGRRYEYEVKKKLEGLGFETLRTSGSHGAFDVIGYDIKKKRVLFVQAKVRKRNKGDVKCLDSYVTYMMEPDSKDHWEVRFEKWTKLTR